LIAADQITAIHRIALNKDGTKRGRRMLGVVSRSAVKLDQLSGDALVVGEGVETAMAVRELMHMALIDTMPVWALGSVGAISFFPLIDGIKQLVILGEIGEASARAIKMCGTRWRRVGRRVRIVMPSDGLSDMNDALIAARSFS
jgi:putative DNA primase/helicase